MTGNDGNKIVFEPETPDALGPPSRGLAISIMVLLGTAVDCMTWLCISAVVILLGTEIDAEMEHQTVRGARMADTVGAAQRG